MKKILYLIENLKIGGAEQLLLTTVKYLNRHKFYPVVYCLCEKGEIGQEIERLGIRVEALNERTNLWNFTLVRKIRHVLKAERPDILHTHLFYANYFGRLSAILAGKPVVVITEHGTHSNFKCFYHHWIDFILSFFTSKIIAVSKAVKEYLASHTLIPENKITVIYNAVDFERFDSASGLDKATIRKQFGFAEHDFLVGCISNLAPWKGQLVLLQAIADSKNRFPPNLKLCIVGRDPIGFQNQLKTFAQEKGIGENVYFLGERRDIPAILKMLDIFVFPSLTEGLGISLLEAMYMGLPSIASKTEGILEIVDDNENGVLVPCADHRALAEKIALLSQDKERLSKLGSNAREKVKRCFNADSYAHKLESLYEGLLKEKDNLQLIS